MTEKRFRYYEHKGADYILDNPNENLDFIEMLGDCLEAEEVVDLLNAFHEENQQLRLELGAHKHPLWSTREAERKVNELTELLMNETKKNAILLEEINSLMIEKMDLHKKECCYKLYKEFYDSVIEQLSYDTPYIRCMNCFASEDSGGMCEGDPSNVYCGSWGHDIDRPVCKDFQSHELSAIDLNADIPSCVKHKLSRAINHYIFAR